jgi:hypothetical protein
VIFAKFSDSRSNSNLDPMTSSRIPPRPKNTA